MTFEDADRKEQGGTTFRMLGAFERWFAKGGEFGGRQLAVLRMLGLFDRPADAGCLAALRTPPVIDGLTTPLFLSQAQFFGLSIGVRPIGDEDWNTAVSFLCELGLVHTAQNVTPAVLDCHPLIRQYFGRQVSARSFQAAHGRVCDHLLTSTEARPSSVEGLEPLYHAVTHGCFAGRFQEMVSAVYQERINRGTYEGGFYSTRVLGAYGSDLEAVAAFFSEPWTCETAWARCRWRCRC